MVPPKMFAVVGEFSACTGQKLTVPNLCRDNTLVLLLALALALVLALVLVFQTGNTKAIGKGEWADKQKLSGMDAASQPSGMISRRFCVQPILSDQITGIHRRPDLSAHLTAKLVVIRRTTFLGSFRLTQVKTGGGGKASPQGVLSEMVKGKTTCGGKASPQGTLSETS